jgi:hypothetical protein
LFDGVFSLPRDLAAAPLPDRQAGILATKIHTVSASFVRGRAPGTRGLPVPEVTAGPARDRSAESNPGRIRLISQLQDDKSCTAFLKDLRTAPGFTPSETERPSTSPAIGSPQPGDYFATPTFSVCWPGERHPRARGMIEKRGIAHAIQAKARWPSSSRSARSSPGPEGVLPNDPDVINTAICAGVDLRSRIRRETRNIDPAEIERLWTATGAVMVTHLHGLACDMAVRIRERNVLVEDAAQAFGVQWNGRPVGTFGKAGIYSFGMYKNVNAFFGGMVVTPDARMAARIRSEVDSFPPQEIGYYLQKTVSGLATDVATWPPLFKSLAYRIFRFGFLHDVALLNSQVTVDADPQIKRTLPESYLRQMTPMQARLVLPQLARVDDHIRARIRSAQMYHEGLRDVPELILPPMRTDFSHTYTYYPIQVPTESLRAR